MISFASALPILFVGLMIKGFAELEFGVRYVISLGWALAVLSPFAIWPMLIINKNNRNDNTSGVLAVHKIAELPLQNPELKDKCSFVLFDNEEWFLLVSSAYKK